MHCQFLAFRGFVALLLVVSGCTTTPPPAQPTTDKAADSKHRAFSPTDAALLDEIQRGAFQYFWNEVGSPAKLVKDRYKAPVSSIAAVGFQLASLPIGVERGWVSRRAAETRAVTVLRALVPRSDNKKFGVYIHFPDLDTGGMSHAGYETLASTVDHALFMAGAIVAAEYFGGATARLTDRVIAETNWQAYATGPEGFLSMGWKPQDIDNMAGAGEFHTFHWHLASDEERLIYFLAAGAPRADFAVAPAMYYKLKRELRQHGDLPPYVVSWPGALFTYMFAHCFIDYRGLGLDEPAAQGVGGAPAIDWFENSRRAVLTHRQRCREVAERFTTLQGARWGLSACDGRDGYIVPEVQPNLSGHDQWYEGTVAPYAAGTAIMFTPEESMAALRDFRQLRDAQGKPLIWRAPETGGYGFVDAFNLDQGYVSDDYIGIDQGPLLIAIENARTGLVWRLFMAHDLTRRSMDRLGLDQ